MRPTPTRLLPFVILGLLVGVGTARAATFVVDSTTDAHDELSTDFKCRTAGGECTLRAAIEQANHQMSPTLIQVPAGVYVVSLPGPLVIERATTIDGPPRPTGQEAIISGDDIHAAFVVEGTAVVTMHDLRINHTAGGCPDIDVGSGGICNYGTLTVERCGFITNHGFNAGGIFNANSATILDSQFVENLPAAIFNWSGSLTVRNTTINGNQSGIVAWRGTITIANSTVTDSAYRGIDIGCYPGTPNECAHVQLANATVNDNLHVYGEVSPGIVPTVTLRNTILASCTGSVTSEGYNLFGPSPTGCAVGGDATGNQNGVDPGLEPLAFNWGITPTRAITGASPAYDTGNPGVPGSGGTTCEATDQRGMPRPGGGRCDIGAFEHACTAGEVCGDGVVEGCEHCDDGNTVDGDCCSSACQVESNGSTCSDGNACTTGDQCSAGVCVSGPPCDTDCMVCNPGVGCEIPSAPTCAAATPAGATIKLVRRAGVPGKDRLQWKWRNATPIVIPDFGSPRLTRYRLCVYDAAGDVTLSFATDGACGLSSNCWLSTAKGWSYKDGHATVDGLQSITLAAGPAGKGRIGVVGKGVGLGLPTLGLTTPVRVRLSRADSGQCWEASFGNGLKKNTAELLSGHSE